MERPKTGYIKEIALLLPYATQASLVRKSGAAMSGFQYETNIAPQ
jgi:hypothetical protein